VLELCDLTQIVATNGKRKEALQTTRKKRTTKTEDGKVKACREIRNEDLCLFQGFESI
jgi:hypothetical protein